MLGDFELYLGTLTKAISAEMGKLGVLVVDFYCPQHRFIIELDGGIHDQQLEYSAARTEQLNQLGYRVIRFRNQAVISDITSVLQAIVNAIGAIAP